MGTRIDAAECNAVGHQQCDASEDYPCPSLNEEDGQCRGSPPQDHRAGRRQTTPAEWLDGRAVAKPKPCADEDDVHEEKRDLKGSPQHKTPIMAPGGG
jgi:hypothetical protein